MGKRFRLNPVMVFLSFLIWGWLWGPIGVFLAVPILIAFKMVVDREDRLKLIRPLISRSVLRRHTEEDSLEEKLEAQTAST
jgi:AI-2 transport protein TqsA